LNLIQANKLFPHFFFEILLDLEEVRTKDGGNGLLLPFRRRRTIRLASWLGLKMAGMASLLFRF